MQNIPNTKYLYQISEGRTSSESSSSVSRPGSPSYSHSQAQSSPIDSRQPKRRSRGKRNQERLTGEQLALKQHLESQFVLNQESYPEHTLKVKKWKNKADNKKVTEEEVFPEETIVSWFFECICEIF